jgi:N,N'-diacetyllegionaminate synthase
VYAAELTLPVHQHHELFESLEMSDPDWQAVAREARAVGVGLAFDVFGPRSLELALACGADAVKIHASDVFNHALLADAFARAPHVYLSTGGLAVEEVEALIARHAPDPGRLTVLVGFQAEPTATADNHLARFGALKRRLPTLALGFMDHADGAADEAGWLAVLTVPYGVTLVEKHLTLDRALELEDFGSAVEPARFARFVARVRAAEAAIGREDLSMTAAERAYRRKALKVVVARRDLAAGARLAADDLRLIRTRLDDGRQPVFDTGRASGRRLGRDLAAGEPVYEDDLA